MPQNPNSTIPAQTPRYPQVNLKTTKINKNDPMQEFFCSMKKRIFKSALQSNKFDQDDLTCYKTFQNKPV
jgi:hypothetical protein